MSATAAKRGWIIAALAFPLSACGDGMLGPGAEPTLALISGDEQPGKAGQDLPEPFVVRVTHGGGGRGAEGVVVTWTVVSGEGAFDGQFELDACPPLGTAQVATDPDGFASVAFTPTWFGLSTVAATVPGMSDSPVIFTTDASDPAATLTLIDGDQQEGKAGEVLPRQMQVMVKDGAGQPVPHVSVTWTTPPAGGSFFRGCPWTTSWNEATTTLRTIDSGALAGVASMSFLTREFVIGTTSVSAALDGLSLTPVSFTVETTTLVIPLAYDGWRGVAYFRRPYDLPLIAAPVGTTVEFRNDTPAVARITSTSVPAGGQAFTSGDLRSGRRFAFVPGVAGMWEFVDEMTGATGRFTAQ